jgi:hypothetical protein
VFEVCRITGWRPTLWQLAVLLGGAPTATWLLTGQLTGLLAVPLTLAWRAWRENRLRHAGLWFGIALSVKPFLGLFVLWMAWRREWPGVVATIASCTGMFIGGALVFGVQAHFDWLAALGAVSWAWPAMNASLLGIAARALTDTPYHVPFAVLPGLVVPLWLGAVAVVGVLLARRLRQASVDAGWTVLAAGTLLVSPLGWTYYLWWLLPGLPRLLSSPVSGALLLIPLPLVALTPFANASSWLSFTLGSAYGWALLWIVAMLGSEPADVTANGQSGAGLRPAGGEA